MNYKQNYEDYIAYVKSLNRPLTKQRKFLKKEGYDIGYFEDHHIIPKCCGGTNEDTNIIALTPREHFLAHYLLCKIYAGKEKYKLLCAFIMMATKDEYKGITKMNSKLYERLKIERYIETSKYLSGRSTNRHWYTNGIDNIQAESCPDGFRPGRFVTEEHKRNVSIKTKEAMNKPYMKEKLEAAGLKRRGRPGASKGIKVSLNKTWMYKNEDCRLIKNEEVDKFLSDGFTIGRLHGKDKKKRTVDNSKRNWEYMKRYKDKKIKCLETDKIYPDIYELMKDMNLNRVEKIIRCCNTGKTHHQYHFSFI
jgi:hypothetical protein